MQPACQTVRSLWGTELFGFSTGGVRRFDDSARLRYLDPAPELGTRRALSPKDVKAVYWAMGCPRVDVGAVGRL